MVLLLQYNHHLTIMNGIIYITTTESKDEVNRITIIMGIKGKRHTYYDTW
jgi:hypothetical protein